MTTLYNTSPAPLSYSTASVSVQITLSVANHLSRSKISISNGFPESKLTVKFKTDGPGPPATDASSRSLCCTNSVRLHLVMISCGTAVIFFVSSALGSNLIPKESQIQLQQCLMQKKPNFLWSPGFSRGMLRLFWSLLITTTLSGLLFIRYV